MGKGGRRSIGAVSSDGWLLLVGKQCIETVLGTLRRSAWCSRDAPAADAAGDESRRPEEDDGKDDEDPAARVGALVMRGRSSRTATVARVQRFEATPPLRRGAGPGQMKSTGVRRLERRVVQAAHHASHFSLRPTFCWGRRDGVRRANGKDARMQEGHDRRGGSQKGSHDPEARRLTQNRQGVEGFNPPRDR